MPAPGVGVRGAAALACLLACVEAFASESPGLQSRIDAAAPGATVEVEPGVHEGALTIDKPLALVGSSSGEAMIDGERSGHAIHVLADDVTIRGLTIRASGPDLGEDHAGIMVEGDGVRIEGNRIEDALHGIYLKRAADGVVAGNRIRGKQRTVQPIDSVAQSGVQPLGDGLCAVPLSRSQRGNGIHLWNSPGNRIEANRIEYTRDGIYFSFSDRTMVRRNRVSHVRFGLHYMYSDENVFENNRFEMNAAGAAIMYSQGLFVRDNTFANNQGRRGYGILVQSVDDTTFLDNRILRNTIGVYLENSHRNRALKNVLRANYIGVRMTGSSRSNGFSANRFARNLHPIEATGGITGNDWALNGRGNRWSGARPVDLDGDGVGELPHHETDVLGHVRQAFPQAGLLSGTPALRVLDFIQSRAPLPAVPGIKDPAPMVAESPSE